MNELKINGRFQLVCPEGFRPLTEAERRIIADGCLINYYRSGADS